ncbi:hypothetical protein BGX21_007611 [Mortierella sp. AD011]|nr:hypothetical protein BGX21_007611 [Mortierella sp. AD011]
MKDVDDSRKSRITSTTGGVDYFLTEVRNIVKTKKDYAYLEPARYNPAIITVKLMVMKAGSTVYRILAAKQKAVYQPILKFRRWFQNKKNEIPAGATDSISNIESNLPPLRGEGTSFESYYSELQKVQGELNAFYNGSMLFKKHQWDSNKAHKAEYAIITDRLLKLIGGSIGRQRDKDCEAVIGVGLGQFATKARLSSLHGSFLSYFVPRINY